jgi:hypothetical protein
MVIVAILVNVVIKEFIVHLFQLELNFTLKNTDLTFYIKQGAYFP